MGRILTTIGFDADDTLWHNERAFQMTQAHFAELLAEDADPAHLMARLLAAERRNLGHYGYGVKGFTLSMIETAIEVTDGRVGAKVIAEILTAGRDMLRHPVEILPFAQDAVEAAAENHRVILITKGDLLDQERKIAESGLRELFHGIEIVSDKIPQVYAEIFSRHGTGPHQGLMIGNSLKSDVLPMIDAGGHGVFVPHDHAWDLEEADAPHGHARYFNLPCLSGLASLISRIEAGL